ncbi:MAG: amiB2 [Frankiales bacterium]|nr:amiB2 [Frankiales bacterium]
MTTTLDEETIAFAGVSGQRRLLRDGTLTAVELLEVCLRRIERLDPQLLAFHTVFDDSAHAEAQAADEALAAGDDRPLLGIPIAVKDSMAVAGHSGSLGTGSPEPPAHHDSEVVRRLRAAGAVIVGTTKLPELALWPFTESATFGTTRNPWALDRTPGGSSGGSAAAVAAGLVAAATASDGGGSIRIPAACCGLVGLKPTRGLVSLAPHKEHWHGLSVAGVLTRSVEDTVTVLNVLQDEPLSTTAPGRLRIAWSMKPVTPTPVTAEVKAALRQVVGRLHDLGHDLVHADPDVSGIPESFLVHFTTGTADDLDGLVDPTATESRTRAVAGVGRRLRGRPFARAMRLRQRATQRLAAAPAGADLLLTPTLPSTPPRVESMTGLKTLALAGRRAVFTSAWNVTGQPALSIPVGLSADGLPLAVQLIGPAHSESLLLSVGAQLENVCRPPL